MEEEEEGRDSRAVVEAAWIREGAAREEGAGEQGEEEEWEGRESRVMREGTEEDELSDMMAAATSQERSRVGAVVECRGSSTVKRRQKRNAGDVQQSETRRKWSTRSMSS